jgi:drug/metabolite transporter (DMT)-like permease
LPNRQRFAGSAPGGSSLFSMVGPLLTIGFGWWLLNESISLAQMAGAALVLLGVLIVSRR